MLYSLNFANPSSATGAAAREADAIGSPTHIQNSQRRVRMTNSASAALVKA